MKWATHFYEILPALEEREDLVVIVEQLIQDGKFWGKAFDGIGRESAFRVVMIDLICQRNTLEEAFEKTNQQLARTDSPHAHCNRTFSKGWAERLVRTHLSRFYNQATLLLLLERGIVECYVPYSPHQDSTSKCSLEIVGQIHDVRTMLDSLVDAFSNGNWASKNSRVPEHPHCTHVVCPTDKELC